MGRGNQILEAAEELFYERGFDGVGVDAIAEKAGITGGGIYRHFSGKGEILAVLFDQAIDSVLERLPTPDDDPDRDLRNLIEAHVHFAQNHPMLAAIWNREQLAHGSIQAELSAPSTPLCRPLACMPVPPVSAPQRRGDLHRDTRDSRPHAFRRDAAHPQPIWRSRGRPPDRNDDAQPQRVGGLNGAWPKSRG